jgi:glycosyltransferase involved in cell wall biosynthesis
MKIAIVLPHLGCGGAERLAVNLANHWASQGFQVDLVAMRAKGELLEAVQPSVNVVDLGVDQIRHFLRPFRAYLRRNRPTVCWANMWPLTSVAVFGWLLAGCAGRLYLTDHTNLIKSCEREMNIPLSRLRWILKATYVLASGFSVVSDGVRENMRTLTGRCYPGARVIHNPATTGRFAGRLPDDEALALWGRNAGPRILSVGTLKEQKNHHLLIDAFSLMRQAGAGKLVIVGEGPLRADLTEHIERQGLQECVTLAGFCADPTPWYRSADLFVLSSGWEGFGNVIVEAMACGVPVVSTDCPSGPAEILENGRHGQLVPVDDAAALCLAMTRELSQPTDPQQLMSRADDFRIDVIAHQYLSFFGLR